MEVFSFQSNSIKSESLQAGSIEEAILAIGRGAYTVFRVFPKRRVFRFEHHFDRLQRSCEGLGIPFEFLSDSLRHLVVRVLDKTTIQHPRICLLIPQNQPGVVSIIVEPFIPLPGVAYQQGVQVAFTNIKRDQPSVKDSGFISHRKNLHKKNPNAHEILLCDERGFFLEGLSSNFFAVRDDILYTAEEGVLSGISRSILLDVARTLIPVNLSPVHSSECVHFSEAFLTSTSRAVLPVTQIGETIIGSGKPGGYTQELSRLYEEKVESELETLN